MNLSEAKEARCEEGKVREHRLRGGNFHLQSFKRFF
jgi:hypothetical protein